MKYVKVNNFILNRKHILDVVSIVNLEQVQSQGYIGQINLCRYCNFEQVIVGKHSEEKIAFLPKITRITRKRFFLKSCFENF